MSEETYAGAARHYSSMVGPEIWQSSRDALESLANCGDREAESIAQSALEHQSEIDSGKYDPNNSADPSD